MSRSSPGVRRVAAILNFVATHPAQPFSMTDLVRALKLSRATCHALLTGLVEVGYLYRATDKTYVLGPALLTIGRAAAENFSPLLIAQPEMRSLADEYDVICSAAFQDGHNTEIRERAASMSHVDHSVPKGTKLTLRPPLAASFLAWMPDSDAKAWMADARPKPTAAQRDMQNKSIDFARRHGFVLFLNNNVTAGKLSPQELFSSDNMEFPIEPATELVDDAHYPTSAITAPVLDATGRVAFVLVLMGFNRSLTGVQVAEIGARLRAACDRISAYIVR